MRVLELRVREGAGRWGVPATAAAAADADPAQPRGAERWALDELGVGSKPTMAEAKSAYHEKAKVSRVPRCAQAATRAESLLDRHRPGVPPR